MSDSSSSASSSSSSVASSRAGDEGTGVLDDLLLGPERTRTRTRTDRRASSGQGVPCPCSLSIGSTSTSTRTERVRTRKVGRGSFAAGIEEAGPSSNNSNKHKHRGNHHQPRHGESDGHKLVAKRRYESPTNHDALSSQWSLRQQGMRPREPKTELEAAVLADCVANHFLLAAGAEQNSEASSEPMAGAIASRFEKATFRKNEIIFREGDAADHLYVLYRGEVLVRTQHEEDDASPPGDDEKDYSDDGDDGSNGYKILGELELLTNSPFYRATAKATSDSCVLFRLGASDFQSYFLPRPPGRTPPIPASSEGPTEHEEKRLFGMLREAMPSELASYFFPKDDQDHDCHVRLWKRLLSERRVRNFQKGDVLVHKSTPVKALVLISDGLVRATENSAGGRSYEDLPIGPGKARTCFGWQSVLHTAGTGATNEASSSSSAPDALPAETWTDGGDAAAEHDRGHRDQDSSRMRGTIVAETDGQAVVISKKSFEKIFCHISYNHERGDRHHGNRSLLMDVAELRRRQWKRTQLRQIMVFKDSALDNTQVNGLVDLMHHCEYGREEAIIKAGQKVEAAMYFVREGSVRLELNKGREKKTIEKGGYFGEKNMLLDQNKNDNEKHYRKRSVLSAISSAAATKVDVLYLEECRKVVNTRILGLGEDTAVSTIDSSVQWADIQRHKLIGTGSFGQVWLVGRDACGPHGGNDETVGASDPEPKRQFFALKVQAKFAVVQSNDADRLIAERNIMASLHSPFIMRLFNAFQDDYRLFMVTSLLPGGELESIVPENGFSESTARFYAAGILEGLTYMHRKHIIHRDVKPENILLNAKGYPVLIDFGFAKYVPEKTYTFCGSPMFMAPETILYQGQNKGVDHWSWAVLVYRLVTGTYPFYEKGMGEMALYKRICKGTFKVTGAMSVDFRMLAIAVLYPDPTERLGSRANGWRDIFDAPWFANSLSSLDLKKLRKQALPAPLLPDGAESGQPGELEAFVHQSSSAFDDLFDNDVCGKIADNQQHIFGSFGSYMSSPIGNPIP